MAIVIFLLFPLEAKADANYVVEGRIFWRMHSWPVRYTIPAFVGRTCVKYSIELYAEFLNTRRTGKS